MSDRCSKQPTRPCYRFLDCIWVGETIAVDSPSLLHISKFFVTCPILPFSGSCLLLVWLSCSNIIAECNIDYLLLQLDFLWSLVSAQPAFIHNSKNSSQIFTKHFSCCFIFWCNTNQSLSGSIVMKTKSRLFTFLVYGLTIRA